ncbi:MAG: acyl-CoA thioesterase [Eudoraea sp.]|nr:acyl-CoA thioesterase [Eudoraea sp.]NNL02416.1 acyl-CoA thioesterase [Eudoraea sp.]
MHFYQFSFRVRYGETDQMGVVYHGNYAQYLEMGRVEWLRDLGISYKSMEENGILLPVISLQLKFVKSAVYDDLITVVTKLKKTPAVRIEFDYEIYNEAGELLVEANTVLAFMNSRTKRPVKCPDYLLNKLLSLDNDSIGD